MTTIPAPEQPSTSDQTTVGFPVVRQLFLLGTLLMILIGAAYLPTVGETAPTTTPPPAPPLLLVDRQPTATTITFSLPDDLPLTAQAVHVWDVQTQQPLLERNADAPLPLASITKLMTALLASEIINDDTLVPISVSALRQDGNSGLSPGERFSFSTLQDYALLASSNDAAYALSEEGGKLLNETDPSNTFVAAMNIRAEELGLTATQFKNPTGLDLSPTEPGAVGSARDVTSLMEYIIQHHPDIVSTTREPHQRLFNEAGAYHDADNTNIIATDIPNLIGSKTGYTDLAGGNLVVAYNAALNRPIIITVLGSTRTGRFVDVMTIVDAINASLTESN